MYAIAVAIVLEHNSVFFIFYLLFCIYVEFKSMTERWGILSVRMVPVLGKF